MNQLTEFFQSFFSRSPLFVALLNSNKEIVSYVDNINFTGRQKLEEKGILSNDIWGTSENLFQVRNYLHQSGNASPLHLRIARKNGLMGYELTINPAWTKGYNLLQVKEKPGYELAKNIMNTREELFMNMLEMAEVAVIMTDKNGKTFYLNQIAIEFLEYDNGEIEKLSLADITHPDDLEQDEKKFGDLLKGKIKSYILEKRFITNSGEVKWGRLHASAISENGSSKYFLFSIIDITDIKNALQQLAEKNEMYIALVDQAPIGIVVHQGGMVKLANKETLRMIDCPRFEDLEDRSIEEFIYPEDKIDVESRIRQMLEKERTVRLEEERLVTFQGKIITAVGNATKVTYNGNPAVQAIFNDITEQKEMERKLWKEKEKSEQYLNVASAVIVILSATGEIEKINLKGRQTLGYEEIEIIGKNWFDLIPPENERERYRKKFLSIIKKGEPPGYNEGIIITKDSRQRIIGWHGSVFRVDEHSNPHLVISGQDITDQKQIEAERLELIKKQERHNKDLQEFTYVVSHNLRSPVSSIIGLVDLAQTEIENPEELRNSFEKLYRTTQELNVVIDDLNEILAARSSGTDPSAPLLFEEVLEPVLNVMSSEIEDSGAKINIDFQEPEVFAVRSYLTNIFYNLTNNAIKYSKPGESPVIDIISKRDGNKVVLTISDNGIGFDAKKSGNRVFELYQRFHSHKEGRGMGLYLVKSQVESMGGEIDFDSKKGKGTTFSITFPQSD